MGRIELPTSPLPRECSTTEPHEPYPALTLTSKLDGAGDEVRTRDILLGRQVLYQLSYSRKTFTAIPNIWWRELDSNQRRRKPTDLQSAPFSRSGISPRTLNCLSYYYYLSIF